MNSDSEKETNYMENNDNDEFNVNKDHSNNIYSSNNKNNIPIKDLTNKTEKQSNNDHVKSVVFENNTDNNYEFLINNNIDKYIKKNKIKRILYKCINLRKKEKYYHNTRHHSFCNSTIEYIYPKQNVKSGYFLKIDHSIDCYNLDKKFEIKSTTDNSHVNTEDKHNFILKCENIMNNSTIFDRRLFKEEFLKEYNNNKYNFEVSKSFFQI